MADTTWDAGGFAKRISDRLELADRLADWIEQRNDEDHPEACAGRLCICRTVAEYREARDG